MTDRELMQQALEALEWASDRIEPQKEPVCDCPVCAAITALRERLAQPEQEPDGIGWLRKDGGYFAAQYRTHWEGCKEVHPECRKPEQEPVAWVTGWHDGHCVIRAANPAAILPIGIALYTTPPRSEWVGLTEAEKVNVAIACGCADVAWMDFADAVEAKLREKNA